MLFGTDGIRGIIDKDIDTILAYNVGKGMALCVSQKNKKAKVVVGYDTRTTSQTYMMAICCGLMDYGVDVDIVGVVSTPIISFLVDRGKYTGGIMITASHNTNKYNGIKLFNSNGEKYNSLFEAKVEKYIDKIIRKPINKGKLIHNEALLNLYINNLLDTFKLNLSDKTIVIDAANGSNYNIAPYVFKKLKANVISINCLDNGKKINYHCGATKVKNLISEVKYHKADLGIAFDGDGDRLVIVLSDGRVISGDDLLLLFGLYLKKINKLNSLAVAGTIMTNLGLENQLSTHGIKLFRSDVGDKKVISLMKDNRISLGGEPSGHICLLDYLPTCDALYNSLFFLNACKKLKINISDFLDNRIYYPSVLKNIEIDIDARKKFDSNSNLKESIKKIQVKYKDNRIVVRPSGTEPVIRLYVEGVSMQLNAKIVDELEKVIKDSK